MGRPSPVREERRKEEVAGERLVFVGGRILDNVPFLEITVGSHSGDYRSRV